MTIKVLVTGGTIDDLEYTSKKDAPKNHKSQIKKLLNFSRVTHDYTVDLLMHKDSRHITDSDRKLITQTCLKSKEDRILITHGTMTMPHTAKYLGLAHLPKTIVLLGAMIPANRPKSDALFNLGAAFMAVQLLPHGVYICMNGNLFSWDNVRKNVPKGVFEKEAQ